MTTQLRAVLRDMATTIAKEHAHGQVEPAHVWLAVARRHRDRPEVEVRYAAVKAALGRRGSAITPPGIAAEAETLLGQFTGDDVALAALLKAFPPADPPSDSPSAAQHAVETQEAPAGQAANATSAPSEETVASVLAELDAMIGLDSVKEQVRRLIAVVEANTQRRLAGLPQVSPSLHLVFTGPPGTGKTTVARIVARLFAAAGALPGRNFVEAGRSDLVAGYVGQTALKVAEVIRRATPGVLFVDEAYALAGESHVDFGSEAIATLVKLMEDQRDRLAIIAAGYEEEMEAFIAANPGLKSRFTTYITFPDYSPSELIRIFEGFATAAQIRLADGIHDRLHTIFTQAVGMPDFGNARFARTLFEHAFARMSLRAAADGHVELQEVTRLLPEDISWDPGRSASSARIGF